MISRANQQLLLTDIALGSSGDLGMDQKFIAVDMSRRVKEAFPSMTEEQREFIMRKISEKLQGHNLDELGGEAESEDEGVALGEAGTQLLESFQQYGGLDTLQKAVYILRGALARCTQGHHYRGAALNNLANALVKLYEQDGDTSKLAEAFKLHREALSLSPAGHPGRAHLLNNLANTLLTQYKQDGDTSKLAEAVKLHREALCLLPEDHPDRATSLNSLANALMTQYEQDGDVSKLAEMVNRDREALSLRPEGHPDRAVSLNNLANGLRTQYQQDGDMSKLAEIIDQHREALSLCPEGHPDRAMLLHNLAKSLMMQYQQDGDISKLAKTVDLHRKALFLRPQGNPDRAMSLNNLTIPLMRQYEEDGDTSKLVETVDGHREALSLLSQGHPERAHLLLNLATTLERLYDQDGDTSKLAEAIDRHHEALSLFSQGHPSRALSLNNLANALMTQYEKDGDMSKLAETVDRNCEALSLRPQGHPDRGISLHNLSNSYRAQFVRDGNEGDLINALKLRRECLDSRIPGHPDRYIAHHSIAQVQLMDSSLFDWEEALDHLMQAMTDNSASPRQRLVQGIQSLRRIEAASARDVKQYFYSQQALDVYVHAIQLLPRAAHAGLDVSARLRALSGSEQLCRAVAMRAMLLDKLPTAVEVFEEGKAVFWSQALRLRSTALDALPTTDNERLSRLFRLLDTDRTGSSVEGCEKVDLEQHIEHRRQLNDQADRLIEDIRRRPGFERFLRIPQYERLAQAASNGYVVALVANEPFYFAIIIQAGRAPQSIFLPSVDGEKLRRLIELTSGSGMRDGVDRGVVKERVPPRVPLEQMWRTIVEPVLVHLGLKVRHDRLI
jgi:hypothetical protein